MLDVAVDEVHDVASSVAGRLQNLHIGSPEREAIAVANRLGSRSAVVILAPHKHTLREALGQDMVAPSVVMVPVRR